MKVSTANQKQNKKTSKESDMHVAMIIQTNQRNKKNDI